MKGRMLVLTEEVRGGEWIAIERLTKAIKAKYPHMLFKYLVMKKRIYSQKHLGFILDAIKYYRYARSVIKNFIKDEQFDYILVSDYLWALAAMGVKLKRTKVIFMFHGLRSTPFKRISDIGYKQLFTKVLERLAWIFSDAITVPSEFAYNYILGNIGFLITKPKVFLVKNIVPAVFFGNNLTKYKKGEYNILYSGRLAKQKGLENLISALFLLIFEIPKAQLWIVYPSSSIDASVKVEIDRLIKEKHLNKNTNFIMDSTENRLSELYKNADISVLPSEFEMAPLSIVESMATGTPIVATNVGNAGELLRKIDINLILNNNSSSELYKKLLIFYSYNKDTRELLGKKSKELAVNFTEDDAVRNFKKVLNFFSRNNSR